MARTIDRKDTLTMRRVRGMNDWDDPSSLPDDIAALVVNMQYHNGGLGRRRYGSVAVTVGGAAFTGVTYLANFVPAGGDPNAELFLVSGDTPKRLLISRSGATADLLTADPPVGTAQFDTATLNNKLFIAYPSGINVLHVYEPGASVVRVTGLTTPGPPATVANNPAVGTYPANKRYYRVQLRTYGGGGATLTRSSALGPSVAFTPSGANTGVDVTRGPADPFATHWALYVSADDATYYFLANAPIGTTVIFDNAPFNEWVGELAPLEGEYTNWPSVKFLCSTGDRLLGFGVHPSAATGDAMVPFNGRVYFSPVLNTTDADDDERVSNTVKTKGWIDIARNAGAVDRGIALTIDHQIMVAQARGLWLLIPTGQADSPYRRVSLSPTLGWMSQWSAVAAEDEAGRPALYFLDPIRGPYRYGASGLQWCGYDIQTAWASVNKNAPDWACHGVYVHATREVRWWVPGFGSNIPTSCLNFAVREGRVGENGDVRGGWSKFIGTPYSTPHTSVMFSREMAVPRSAVWQPYLGFMSPAPLLTRADEALSQSSDNGTSFRTYLVSRAWTLDPQQVVKQIIRAWITAMAVAGGNVTLTTIRNYGDERRTSSADLSPNPFSQGPGTPEPTSVQRRFDNASLTDAWAFQFEVGDPATFTGSSPFGVLDQLMVTVEYGSET